MLSMGIGAVQYENWWSSVWGLVVFSMGVGGVQYGGLVISYTAVLI